MSKKTIIFVVEKEIKVIRNFLTSNIMKTKEIKTAERIINDAKMTATEKWDLLKGIREKEKEILDQVYDFISEHINKDDLKTYADKSWFTTMDYNKWYKDTYLNPATWVNRRNKMDGVDDYLGHLIHIGEYDKFMEDIKFNEFLGTIDTHCDVHLKFVGGHMVNIRPLVYFEVDLLD